MWYWGNVQKIEFGAKRRKKEKRDVSEATKRKNEFFGNTKNRAPEVKLEAYETLRRPEDRSEKQSLNDGEKHFSKLL